MGRCLKAASCFKNLLGVVVIAGGQKGRVYKEMGARQWEDDQVANRTPKGPEG